MGKKKYASIIARIYTDLTLFEIKNIPLAESYLEIVKEFVDYCADKLIVKFNIHYREYEIAIQKFFADRGTKKNFIDTVERFEAYFVSNEPDLKREYGIQYSKYKMDVLLAKMNVSLLTGRREKKEHRKKIIDELSLLEPLVHEIATLNEYYYFRLLYLRDEPVAFNDMLNKYYRINREHNTLHKFESQVKMLIQAFGGQIIAEAVVNICKSFLTAMKTDKMVPTNSTQINKSTLFPPVDFLLRAKKAYQDKHYIEAVRLYKSVIENSTNQTVENYINLGHCYYCLRNYEKAILFYEKALEKDHQAKIPAEFCVKSYQKLAEQTKNKKEKNYYLGRAKQYETQVKKIESKGMTATF